CNSKTTGPRNVGTRLSGNLLIAWLVTSLAKIPNGVGDVSIPVPPDTSSANTPKRCHRINPRFGTPSLDTNRDAAIRAVLPIVTSLSPVGIAKAAGKLPLMDYTKKMNRGHIYTPE